MDTPIPAKDETVFYSAHELAEKLSLNVMTIYRYIKAGRLKAYKIGKEFRIEKTDFEEFLRETSTK
jgi:excisionase family DNA binding protein